jgi:hypothetical protein
MVSNGENMSAVMDLVAEGIIIGGNIIFSTGKLFRNFVFISPHYSLGSLVFICIMAKVNTCDGDELWTGRPWFDFYQDRWGKPASRHPE